LLVFRTMDRNGETTGALRARDQTAIDEATKEGGTLTPGGRSGLAGGVRPATANLGRTWCTATIS